MSPMTQFTIVKNGKPFYSIKDERQAKVNGGNSEPLSFVDIFGDLSGYKFSGNLDMTGLNLSSLKGAPLKMASCEVFIHGNPNLKKCSDNNLFLLEGSSHLDYAFVQGFVDLGEQKTDKVKSIMVYNSNIDTAERQREVLATLFIVSQIFDCSIKMNDLPVDAGVVNDIKDLYEKVDYDKDKLLKVVSLL